jgi:hypothetical protein
MTTKSLPEFTMLEDDDLDRIVGGAGPNKPGEVQQGYQGMVGVGPFSLSVTRLDNGTTYLSPGVGVGPTNWGISLDRVTVTPKAGQTADDVLAGGSDGFSGHAGVGGTVSWNDSGSVTGVGIGLELGAGKSYGIGGPNESQPGINQPGPGQQDYSNLKIDSPGEYAGYVNAGNSPAGDRYEPNSPELQSAIGAYNNSSSNDVSPTTSSPGGSFNGNDYNGSSSTGGGTTVASYDNGGTSSGGSYSEAGGSYAGGDIGGGGGGFSGGDGGGSSFA